MSVQLSGAIHLTRLQVNSISDPTHETPSNGPVWSRFFASFGGGSHEGDSESVISGSHQDPSQIASSYAPMGSGRDRSRHDGHDYPMSELAPGDSASVVGEELDHSELGPPRKGTMGGSIVDAPVIDDGTYLFKFSSPGGVTHRFQARYDSFENLRDIIAGKLHSDPFFIPEDPSIPVVADSTDFQLSYLDDDGDLVLMTSDRDASDAVQVAKKQGKDRVVLHLRGGKGWDEQSKKLKEKEAEKSVEMSRSVSRVEEKQEKELKTEKVDSQGEMFMGLPKDLILPASIAFLGVAIIGVFILSRTGSGGRR
jgi:hypothetical protein